MASDAALSVEAVFEQAAAQLAAQLTLAAAPPDAGVAGADELAGVDFSTLDAALAALDAADVGENTSVPGEQAKAASTLTPELQEKIIQQIEFYFSDENLPTDEFLLSRVKQNKMGWGENFFWYFISLLVFYIFVFFLTSVVSPWI